MHDDRNTTMWIDDKPSEPGYYWFRQDEDDWEPHIVEVSSNYVSKASKRIALYVYETGEYSCLLEDYEIGQWQPVVPPATTEQGAVKK